MGLFTPVVSEDAQHANFRTITKFANAYNEDVLNEWARGFKDRDGKLVKEFQTTRHTRSSNSLIRSERWSSKSSG